MRVYFFGDIHGNGYALEACLRHAEELNADEILCLGDLVGWLPFGNRTLTRMRPMGIPTVAGNHDLLVAGLFKDHPDQIDRMQATAYNAGVLSTLPGADEYLLGLPLTIEREGFVVVHHSPFHLPGSGEAPTIDSFNYLDEGALRDCLDAWRAYPKRLIVSGHDHIPAIYELKDTPEPPRMEDVTIHRPSASNSLAIAMKPDCRYWVKAGSIGGPYRDGVPVANPVLVDSTEETLTLFRLPYPTRQLADELIAHRFCCNLPTIQRYVDLLRDRGQEG